MQDHGYFVLRFLADDVGRSQKDHALVEYALAGMDIQLFVSKYQLDVPDREQLQRELERTLKKEV